MTNDKLPQGWVECQLKDIAIVKGGKRLPAGAQYAESMTKYPYIRVTNFENMTVNTNDLKYLTPEIQNKIKNYTISKEDIYISIAGSIGKVGIIPDELDGANLTENAAKIIHCINKKFLTYILNSIEIQNQISTYTKSTTQPKLALYRIEELKIPLPPQKEQRRIVEKIESEFAKIDEGLEHLEKAKEQIKQYRQSVLKSAFSNCSSYIKVGELCEVVRGGSPRPAGDEKYYNGHIPFLKVADITKDNNKYLNEYTYTIKEAGLKKTRLVNANTLLLSNSGATLGVPKICTFATTFNDGIAAFLGLSNETLDFHYYYWLSKTKELRCINQGAAQPNLNTDIIKEQLIPNLNKFEQKEIVEEIEKRFAIADEVEKVVEDNIEKAKQLKQSILKKAFEGNLVPQEPTDEPASTLLEKIKQERSKK